MEKKLDKEFGRFDVDLLDSAEYLHMPEAIRNHAYLYLLALTGWSRKHRTDGLVTRKVAREFATRMGCDLRQLLRALAGVDLVAVQSGDVFVTKYSKWQETKDEIEARKEANRIRQQRHRNALVTPDSRVSHVTEKEREKEREILNAPLTPTARPLSAFEDGPTAELAKGMHELFGRALSALDVVECQAALNQYAYLTSKDMLVRAHEHVAWCKDASKPAPRTVAGFGDSWRRENEYRADHGHAKVDRMAGGRVTGMTKAFQGAA